MAIVKLKAGETVLVAALTEGQGPDQGLPGAEPPPVDPGYGIDLGLGWLRPTHPIAPGGGQTPGTPPPRPHPIPEPPEPVDPAYGIDEDAGFVKPTHPIVLPGAPELKWDLVTAWTPTTGWVVVAVPEGEHATPSKGKR